jgi:Fur family ferric uptake transcriptional regulator
MAGKSRNTVQRREIERIFEQAGRPLGPREVVQAADRLRAPSIATVYRAIRSLLAAGRLAAVHIPGEPPRYEPAGADHHHQFHCRACGQVSSVNACPGNLRPMVPRGYRLEGHTLVLFGLCNLCARPRRGRKGR